MDPLSIATACYTLLTAIKTLTRSLTTFTRSVHGARRDVDGFLRELASLALCLETLRDEEFPFPTPMKTQLIGVLNNCDGVVQEMSTILDGHRQAGVLRQVQWSIGDSQEVTRVRQRLEAYKSVLEITLELANLTVLNGIRGDTRNILAEVAALRAQVAQLSATGPSPNPMLQRFLNETVTYAESLADPFTDEVEGPSDRDTGATYDGPSQTATSANLEPATPQPSTVPQRNTQSFGISGNASRHERTGSHRQDFARPLSNAGHMTRTTTSDHGHQGNNEWSMNGIRASECRVQRDRLRDLLKTNWHLGIRLHWKPLVGGPIVRDHYLQRLYSMKIPYDHLYLGLYKAKSMIMVYQPNDAGTARVKFLVRFASYRSSQPIRMSFTLEKGSPEDFLTVLSLHFTVCDFDYGGSRIEGGKAITEQN